MFNTGASASGNQVSYCYSKFGTYSPSLIATTVNGCTDTLTKPFYINVYPKPIAGFSINPTQVSSFYPTTTITNYSSADVVNWAWTFGDGTSSNVQNPGSHTFPTDKDEYIVNLVVTNNFGCKDSTFHLLLIRQESSVYVPNAFTPNQDGNNETFRPYCSGIYLDAEYQMDIYDRWGIHLFNSKELDKGWDGTINDRVCQQDVYVYKITFVDKSDGTLLKRFYNIVTLIR